ncbi:HNH endonuclease [Mycolicibacterium sp. J2]|uniref:HNH endonuclease n=1 Tax=Mycolicibacterium sp. J2 TaxID=2993511 RepID=UPI00224B12D7|nr:HNH endonuclease [Mycolicibacterium sp. J2]MCX2710796.1 HNH endonuclease [Mycolicibacterium sp. J2]
MRPLVKRPKPEILEQNEQAWTTEYVDAVRTGQRPFPSRWRREEIKSTLVVETSGRCAYCESDMLSVHYGHVEHIRPRKAYPELVVRWDNLTLACEKCNGAKKDFYSDATPLLNPYVDDPTEHIVFHGHLVFAKPGSDRGVLTIRKLKLHRKDLTDQRQYRLEHVMTLIDLWSRATDPDVKEELLDSIVVDYRDGPYQMVVKPILAYHGINVE